MKRLIPFIVLAAVGILAGCRVFSGNIAFENESDRPVWVADVDGFKRQPPVGILSKGAGAYSRMDPMPIPEEVIIHWSYEWHRSDFTTKISLREAAVPGKDEELLFRFTKDQKWEVGIKKWK
jgi:hypothetical protein